MTLSLQIAIHFQVHDAKPGRVHPFRFDDFELIQTVFSKC